MIVTYERNVLVAFILRNLFYLVFFFFREIPSFKIIKTRRQVFFIFENVQW